MARRDLYQKLWNSADVLRSKMDANEYKNYLLGIVFYKYLSEKQLMRAAALLEEAPQSLEEAQVIYEQALEDEGLKEDLLSELNDS